MFYLIVNLEFLGKKKDGKSKDYDDDDLLDLFVSIY